MIDQNYLLESAQSGNAEAFGFLYDMYRNSLYLYAFRFLGNREDAEDAVQQASIKVYMSIRNIKNPDAFKSYYFKALANTARSMLVARNLHIVGSEDDLHEVASDEHTENTALNRAELDRAFAVLNDNEREIVLLSTVGGFNSKEISKITSLTGGSVRSKLSRALTKMRSAIEAQ